MTGKPTEEDGLKKKVGIYLVQQEAQKKGKGGGYPSPKVAGKGLTGKPRGESRIL